MSYGGEGVGLSGASSSLVASTLLALCVVALASAQTQPSSTTAPISGGGSGHVEPQAGQRVTLDARWVGGLYCRMTANGYERGPKYRNADCAKFYRELYLADRFTVMACWLYDPCGHYNQHRGQAARVWRDPWCLPDGTIPPDAVRCMTRQMRHRSGG